MSYQVYGIVLKRHDLGEADKIVTLFTRDQGKITVKAKGLRKVTSRRAGSLELFHQVKALIIPGKSTFDIIADVELIQSSFSWRKFLGRITIAYQLVEVI